ncbi:unnamed protein product [Adineta steineri]|uniref:Uncharacterized protein n=1 Tax=Adineta steineri TaxID=433720 RepID=A0A815U374_9BILA|nr:unnamed protein product [Adineta steineri]CAF4156677.1 unnamed protein product [Adineta steineri]
MPPKTGGTKGNKPDENQINTINSQQSSTTKINLAKQSSFSIASLVLNGVKFNKLQVNIIIKQYPTDIRISDIQLDRTGVFTIYAIDINSFNHFLNEFSTILAASGPTSSKMGMNM